MVFKLEKGCLDKFPEIMGLKNVLGLDGDNIEIIKNLWPVIASNVNIIVRELLE